MKPSQDQRAQQTLHLLPNRNNGGGGEHQSVAVPPTSVVNKRCRCCARIGCRAIRFTAAQWIWWLNLVCLLAHTTMVVVVLWSSYWRWGRSIHDADHVTVQLYRLSVFPTKEMIEADPDAWKPERGWNLTGSSSMNYNLRPAATINYATLTLSFFACSAIAHAWAVIAGASAVLPVRWHRGWMVYWRQLDDAFSWWCASAHTRPLSPSGDHACLHLPAFLHFLPGDGSSTRRRPASWPSRLPSRSGFGSNPCWSASSCAQTPFLAHHPRFGAHPGRALRRLHWCTMVTLGHSNSHARTRAHTHARTRTHTLAPASVLAGVGLSRRVHQHAHGPPRAHRSHGPQHVYVSCAEQYGDDGRLNETQSPSTGTKGHRSVALGPRPPHPPNRGGRQRRKRRRRQ